MGRENARHQVDLQSGLRSHPDTAHDGQATCHLFFNNHSFINLLLFLFFIIIIPPSTTQSGVNCCWRELVDFDFDFIDHRHRRHRIIHPQRDNDSPSFDCQAVAIGEQYRRCVVDDVIDAVAWYVTCVRTKLAVISRLGYCFLPSTTMPSLGALRIIAQYQLVQYSIFSHVHVACQLLAE